MVRAVDTSIVIRLSQTAEPIFKEVNDCLIKLLNQGETLVIFPQILVEFWAVATRPKIANGLGFSTELAEKGLKTLQGLFTLLPENEKIFDEWQKLVTSHKVSGKPTHDARIVATMNIHKVNKILTLNANDFRRYTEIEVVTPQQVLAS